LYDPAVLPFSQALAVLSAAAYGAADFLGGLATKRGSGVFSVVVVSQLAGLVLVLIAGFFLSSTPSGTDLLWGAAGGIAGAVGLALLYHGLAVGKMSVVAPVTAVCAVILPVAVGAALGERPPVLAQCGILLAVVSIVLISRSDAVEDGREGSGLALAIASGVAIGVFLVCLERTGPAAGLWPLVAARASSVSLLTIVAVATGKKLAPKKGSISTVLGCGLLDMTANVLYLLAVRQGQLGIVATLTSLYPASTILLARFVLREKLTSWQKVGVVCAGVAIVLIVAR
jgi:drug/metabolite transporter (DMT)-like permease